MAVRRILELGDETLRRVSAPALDPGTARRVMQDLEDTLADFRARHGFGRGISAIQIGEPLRLIFLHVEGRRYELVNPVYVEKSEETFELWDDCFSFPDLMVRLRRHVRVVLEHEDLQGKRHRLEAEWALSELIQHEMDHLDGILAVDHARSGRDFMTRREWLRQKS
ncbi:MAG: peptide deformylase [Bryobacteraceae bacterium]|nr:peptide deformylase [Bryobacteraceae bacterium]MCX7603403.1 peptide deformylase [Bryobacteraceae bacterium]